MEKKKQEQPKEGKHEHRLPQEISDEQRLKNESALEEAMHDIDEDPDLSVHSPNDDLDEGELSRLGEDKPDLV
jgi:hypothetical protein